MGLCEMISVDRPFAVNDRVACYSIYMQDSTEMVSCKVS
jgi:hypothetical protein